MGLRTPNQVDLLSTVQETYVDELVSRLSSSLILAERTAMGVRNRSQADIQLVYDDAFQEWYSSPEYPKTMPNGDMVKSGEYYTFCDEICKKTDTDRE